MILKIETNNPDKEAIKHIREYLDVMKDEPAEELIKVKDVYHHLRRILGDED